MASCLKYAVLQVCQSKNKQAAEKGKVGQDSFRGERATEQCCCEQLWHSQISPPDCFQLVLEPWAFWVLEAGPDPTIPPAPHPAA